MKPVVSGLVAVCILMLVLAGRMVHQKAGIDAAAEPIVHPETPVDQPKLEQRSKDRTARPGDHPAPPAPTESPWAERVTAFEAESDSDQRDAELEAAATGLTAAERFAALDELANDERSAARELKRLLLTRCSDENPGATARWAASLPTGSGRTEALERIAATWADQDPAAATDWIQSLHSDPDRPVAVRSAAYEIARTDPTAALALASSLPATWERDELILHAASQWSSTDTGAAAHWSAQVTDPALRQRLLGAVAQSAADINGANGAQLAAQSLNGTDEQTRAVIGVIQRWSQISPAAAADWIAQFPAAPLRTEAAQTLIQQWAADDPQSAGEWVRDLADGALKSAATAAYLGALSEAPTRLGPNPQTERTFGRTP